MTDLAPADVPPAVLALHGLGGGRFELAPLLDALERTGCRVESPVLPGHAVDGPIMPASVWRDWAATSERAFDDLAALSLKATLSALELIDHVQPLVSSIRTPTLILQGKLDTVVDPAGASWLMDHLGSPEKRFVRFAKSDHLLALDHDGDQVVAVAVAFALEVASIEPG